MKETVDLICPIVVGSRWLSPGHRVGRLRRTLEVHIGVLINRIAGSKEDIIVTSISKVQIILPAWVQDVFSNPPTQALWIPSHPSPYVEKPNFKSFFKSCYDCISSISLIVYILSRGSSDYVIP